MKLSQGKANPRAVNEILKKTLGVEQGAAGLERIFLLLDASLRPEGRVYLGAPEMIEAARSRHPDESQDPCLRRKRLLLWILTFVRMTAGEQSVS